MKHILVISQYFYPEQFRINDICTEWVKRGYKVTVLTGIPNYPYGKYFKGYGVFKKRKEQYNGMKIIRIPIIPRGKNSIMMILNYISFVICGFFWKLFTKVKADIVFIFEVSPMTQALPGVWYAKRRKIPCFLYVQDLWPENVEIITGISNKLVINSIGKMVDNIYKNCDQIFTTSESFTHSIKNRGVDKNKIVFWPQYAEDIFKPISCTPIDEIPNNGALNAIFAGNIGKAQGLELLPKVAKRLKDLNHKKDIVFNIVGDGRYKEELIQTVNNLNVNNYFNFISRQPQERIPAFYSSCNIGLLCLNDNPIFKMTIPAKLQTYLASGLPIFASASGEVKKIIKDSNAGICVYPGDVDSFCEELINYSRLENSQIETYASNARNYYLRNFNKSDLLDIMDSYIKKFTKDKNYV